MTLPFPNAVETDSEEWSDVLAELQYRRARPHHFTEGKNGELLTVDNRTGEVLAAVVYHSQDSRTYFLAQEIKP